MPADRVTLSPDPSVPDADVIETGNKVIDLMAALKASLDGEGATAEPYDFWVGEFGPKVARVLARCRRAEMEPDEIEDIEHEFSSLNSAHYEAQSDAVKAAIAKPAPDTPSPLSSLVPSGWLTVSARGIAWRINRFEGAARNACDALNREGSTRKEDRPFRLVPLVSLEDVSSRISELEAEVAQRNANAQRTAKDYVDACEEITRLRSEVASLVQREADMRARLDFIAERFDRNEVSQASENVVPPNEQWRVGWYNYDNEYCQSCGETFDAAIDAARSWLGAPDIDENPQ